MHERRRTLAQSDLARDASQLALRIRATSSRVSDRLVADKVTDLVGPILVQGNETPMDEALETAGTFASRAQELMGMTGELIRATFRDSA